MVRPGENDENARPGRPNAPDRPNDEDRARFGFKAPSRSGTLPPAPFGRTLAGAKELGHCGADATDAASVASAASSTEDIVPVDLMAMVADTFGDPDVVLPLLRMKPTAGKYDFKDRIADLQDMIQPLKTALSDQRQRAKALTDTLESAQGEINSRMSSLSAQLSVQRAAASRLEAALTTARREADERGRRNEELRETLAASRREQEKARKHGESQAGRATAAEALVREKDADLAALRKEVEEARGATRLQQVAAAEASRQLESCRADCRLRVDEAAELLRRQMDDAARDHQQMVFVAQQREAELTTELSTSSLRARDLESQLAATARARDEALQAHANALREAQQAAEAVAEQRVEMQARLLEMDSLLEQKDAHLRESIQSLKFTHQAQLENKEELLRQKDTDVRESIQSNKAMHKIQLEEKEELLKQKEAHLRESILSIKLMHQSQLSDKEELLRQKDIDIRDNLQSLKATHQAQLDEKDDLVRQKDGDSRESLQSMKVAHQAVLDEKDEVLRQKDADLRETIQSMKSLQRDGGEQLMSERQRAQRLQEELQVLRVAEEQMRSDLQASSQQAERLQAELASGRRRASELQTQLRAADTECDRLQEQAAESALAARAQKEDLTQVTSRLAATQQELAAARAQLASRGEEAEELRLRFAASSDNASVAKAELAACRRRVADLEACVRRADAERERTADEVAEVQAALQEEVAQRTGSLTTAQKELGELQLQLASRAEEAVRLSQERRMLEVEFRSYKEHHGTSNQQQMEAIAELKLKVDHLSNTVQATQLELGNQQGNLSQQHSYIQSLEQQLSRAERTRRDLHNAIQELKGNIRVFCRVRPGEGDTAVQLPEVNKLSLSHAGERYPFSFDKVFPDNTCQETVFDEVSGLVQSALDGYKVCIFAYGQTGSGKTFTMQGTTEPSSWGLIPRALRKIFETSESMRAKGWEWSLQASFMEVYNEALRDLLRDGGSTAAFNQPATSGLVHVIKHDDAWGTVVTNMSRVSVESMDQITSLMAKAARQRAVGATDMNAVSSRSHSIFALYLRGVNRDLNSELHGALHLVDLAGSERLDKSGSTGDRLKETQNINRSLSSLADVFLAKSEVRSHVPFRNSKLTHLMEPCLSGQGKTLMVVNVGPEQENAHETLCSLRFASQVSQCDTGGKPKRNARPAGTPAAAPAPSFPRSETPARQHGNVQGAPARCGRRV